MYNSQTDTNHYHVYHAYTVDYGDERYHEVHPGKKVAVIAVPDYGPKREIDLIKEALEKQHLDTGNLRAIEDGYVVDDFGDAIYFIEL